MKNKIPTAVEFLRGKPFSIESIHSNMIEFAKLHVEMALKEALESIPCLGSSSDIATYEEVEDAVLNAYPLTLIK
jgi:hypothetical protein